MKIARTQNPAAALAHPERRVASINLSIIFQLAIAAAQVMPAWSR